MSTEEQSQAPAEGDVVAWASVMGGQIMNTTHDKALAQQWKAMGGDVRTLSEHQPKHTACEYCDGTGDVHRADGEWLGECNQCPAAALHAFKNFHRLLCERFGYGHDEKDWRRDQLSLIEFIAAKVQSPAPAPEVPAGMALVPLSLIQRAQQAINWHLEPASPAEHNATMLELSAIGWPGSVPPAKAPAVGAPLLARAKAEWHEDDGPVMWWAWNGHGWAGEPAWIGTPLDAEWPGYHTHWTAHPAQPTTGAKQ